MLREAPRDSALQIYSDARRAHGARSLCVMLGSFDPPHLGHEWIVRQLLGRFERVLVLLPGRHFDKRIVAGRNATLAERRMLLDGTVAEIEHQPKSQGRLLIGLTEEVLFVRLVELVSRRFPEAAVSLAVGLDTSRKLARSAGYFHRLGLPWGDEERRRLALLQRRMVVFARASRGGAAPAGARRLPAPLARLSSTLVRLTLARGWRRGDQPRTLRRLLHGLVSASVGRRIVAQRLYHDLSPCRAANGCEQTRRQSTRGSGTRGEEPVTRSGHVTG